MKKSEFLNILRDSLAGELSQNSIDVQINYYSDYINSEVRMGRTEEEVIRELGNPRLIAKTIINTQTSDQHQEKQTEEQKTFSKVRRPLKFNTWLTKFIGIVILILVILFIFLLIGGLAVLFVNLAFPLLIFILIIYLFKRKG